MYTTFTSRLTYAYALLGFLFFRTTTTSAEQATSCITVESWSEFTSVLSSASSGDIINFCPFDISHDGLETDGYTITTPNLRISCDKKSGSAGELSDVTIESTSNWNRDRSLGLLDDKNYHPSMDDDSPKCLISGSSRHLNIDTTGTVMIGFNFEESTSGALSLSNNAVMTTLLHLVFTSNIRESAYGSSIEVKTGAKMTSIINCAFFENKADDGGAISANSDVIIYRSYFHDNAAVLGEGGAITAEADSHVVISRSEFYKNNVEGGNGPAVYDVDSGLATCNAGENIACLNLNVDTDEYCDGISYASNNGDISCENFDNKCHAPSVMPSPGPTKLPTTNPTVAPSKLPTAGPSALPTRIPTVIPTDYPTLSPSVSPTALPSFVPTPTPTNLPSIAPTEVPTSSPTVAPSALPSYFPTPSPTLLPTEAPSANPSTSSLPSCLPSLIPSTYPTPAPSPAPSESADDGNQAPVTLAPVTSNIESQAPHGNSNTGGSSSKSSKSKSKGAKHSKSKSSKSSKTSKSKHSHHKDNTTKSSKSSKSGSKSKSTSAETSGNTVRDRNVQEVTNFSHKHHTNKSTKKTKGSKKSKSSSTVSSVRCEDFSSTGRSRRETAEIFSHEQLFDTLQRRTIHQEN